MTAAPPSGTVTFTDVEGSTALWQDRPQAMAAAPSRHDVNDLVPAPASDPTTFVDDRRAGAAMSADEIVDHVLDELRSATGTATMH